VYNELGVIHPNTNPKTT